MNALLQFYYSCIASYVIVMSMENIWANSQPLIMLRASEASYCFQFCEFVCLSAQKLKNY